MSTLGRERVRKTRKSTLRCRTWDCAEPEDAGNEDERRKNLVVRFMGLELMLID